MRARFQHILLTGPPGCGKTTVVQRIIERLDALRVAGFYTREIRQNGVRVGFEAVGLHRESAVLAHTESRSPARVGKYGVEVEQFEGLLRTALNSATENVDLFVVDEIGKMECLSQTFVEKVKRILEADVPVLATVALKGGGFISEVKQREDVDVISVTRANRTDLPNELSRRLLG